jgi:hypothetical protein
MHYGFLYSEKPHARQGKLVLSSSEGFLQLGRRNWYHETEVLPSRFEYKSPANAI